MPSRNLDLHGAAPDKASVALLLIDVINDLEFPGSNKLLKRALPAAKRIAALKQRARGRGVPVIYVKRGRRKAERGIMVGRVVLCARCRRP